MLLGMDWAGRRAKGAFSICQGKVLCRHRLFRRFELDGESSCRFGEEIVPEKQELFLWLSKSN